MRAEFSRSDEPSVTLGVARWQGGSISIDAEDPVVRSALERVFRSSSVVVTDPSLVPLGARGEVVLRPGGVDWFRAAARTRASEEGFSVRLVPEVSGEGGWDPASAYRPFRQAVDRILARTDATSDEPQQPGETPSEERVAALGRPPEAPAPPARN